MASVNPGGKNFWGVSRWLMALMVMVSVISCGGARKVPIYPTQVTSEIRDSFNTADRYYQSRQFRLAGDSYHHFIDAYPYNKLTDEAYYKLGKIHFIQSKWDATTKTLSFLINTSPDPVYRSKASLLSAHAVYKLKQYDRAISYLNKIEDKDLPAKLQLRYYSLLIATGKKTGLSESKIDYYWLRLADVYEGSAGSGMRRLRALDVYSYRQTRQAVKAWIVKPMAQSRVPSWFRDYPKGFSRAYVDYKWGKLYVEAGQNEKAKRQLARFIQSYPKHLYADPARKMLEDLGGEVTVSAGGAGVKIGVIIPRAGPRAQFGQELLKGIQCAAMINSGCQAYLNSGSSAYPVIEILVRDSISDEGIVLGLVDELASEGVSAIVGPMSASLATVAARRAQQVKVPLFPITQRAQLMSIGDFVFQMGYESDSQVKDLVSRAIRKGLKSFGVFYPNNNYGQGMKELFLKEVERQGGHIESTASYNPGEKDMAIQARELKLNVSQYSYRGKSSGFEALFIPDSYWMVNRLGPTLNFVDIKDIPLLGPNAWNDPKLAPGVLKSFPGSFFVSLYYPGSQSALTQKFIKGFETGFGRQPTTINALGFDAVWFVRQAEAVAKTSKRREIQKALLSIGTFEGVTGIRSFSAGDGPNVSPVFLTSTKKGIVRAP